MQSQGAGNISEEDMARITKWHHVPGLKCLLETHFSSEKSFFHSFVLAVGILLSKG